LSERPDEDAKRRFTSSDTYGGSAHRDLFGPADDAAIIRAAIEALDTPDAKDCPKAPGPAPGTPEPDPTPLSLPSVHRRTTSRPRTPPRPGASPIPAIGSPGRTTSPSPARRIAAIGCLGPTASSPPRAVSPTWRPVPAIGVAGASAG